MQLGHSFSANRQCNSAEGEEKVWREGGMGDRAGREGCVFIWTHCQTGLLT